MPRGKSKRRFWLPGLLRSVDRDVQDELQFHLDMRAAELERAGLAPGAARAEAERRFGDLSGARSELSVIDQRRLRGVHRAEWWDGVVRDFRYALRGLKREPGFALAVITTIGFGLGATSAMFGIVDRLLLRPPAHVVDPGTIGKVYYTEFFSWIGSSVTQSSTSYPDFVSLRDHSSALAGVAAYYPNPASYGLGRTAQQARRVAVSGRFFGVLGVRPALGRFFGPEADVLPNGEPVAVISDAFWRREFGRDPHVIGRTIDLDAFAYTVVGVAPAGFTGVDLRPVDVWVPLSTIGASIIGDQWAEAGGWRWIRLVARLAPGATRAQADAEATSLYRAALEARNDPDSTARVTIGSIIAARAPNGSGSGASEARISLWLTGVALLVLAIACANAANLLLARSVRRRKEIGIRVALGAGRARLVRQFFVESIVLTGLGGVAGLVLARWGGGLLRALLLPEVAWRENTFDPRLLAVAAALVVLVAIATGLAPVMHTLSANVVERLRAGVREGTGHRSRLRGMLVLVQASLSVVLLVGAGLFVRSLRYIRGVELGFDATRVLLVDMNLRDMETEARYALYHQARDRVVTLPVVEQASVATTAPFWSSMSTDLHVPGLDSIPRTSDGGPYFNAVTPEFFETMGTRIVRGRGFLETDGHGAPRVTVVSETMARLFWRGEDPLGKCMFVGADTVPCSTVVGVAQDARRQSLTDDAPVLQYYLPLNQRQVSAGLRVLVVRTRGDPEAARAAVRREVQSVSADLPYPTVQYVARQVEDEIRPWKLGATLFSLFGALALALAGLGLYSVVAYSVVQRRHEMGVRVALGARGLHVAHLVLIETLRVIGIGLGLGLVASFFGGRWIKPLLFQVSPRDPVVLFVVIATLLTVGVLASLIPARRAARVSPAEVLKAE
jgi:putative ABC transport system permease protein